MGRRQIDALIKSDPTNVTFKRRTKINVAGGGWRWGPEQTLDPQEVKLTPFKRRMTEFLVDTQYGEVKDLPYIMVGRWNLDVEEGDTFWHQGEQYTVRTIDLDREERTACHIDYFGAQQDGT